jgi:putative FmdB family regulatory protein
MPIYEYRCENGHNFEVIQSMSDDPVEACEECGAPVERVFHPVAVHFKGSGFYTTDYANKGKAGGAPSTDSDSGSSDKKETDSGSGSGSSEKKSDSGSGSGEKKSDSGSSAKKSGSDSKTKTASSSD